MAKELLQLKDISMSFVTKSKLLEGERSLKILRNINLTINQGEIVVIVGESGCGKTTIGKIITGLLKPTDGELLFLGRDIYKGAFASYKKVTIDESQYAEQLKNMTQKQGKVFLKQQLKQYKKVKADELKEFENSVQFIQQDSYAALNPARTIYQSLFAPIKSKNRKMSKEQIDAKIDELLKLVGLYPSEQYLFKFPHQLSGGQRQRILMARAVSLSPKLIVADEPVSMIDVSLRLSILDLMKELNDKFKISFVYITHDLSTARYIAYHGRICVMYLGEIVEMGSVEDVVKSPHHPYTQALFSAVPIPDPEISRKVKKINIKSMEVGNLVDRKNGCPFYNRCIYGQPNCENDKVAYQTIDGVEVLCKHISEVPKWEQNN